MRLWSIHPKYLDAKGLVALWREGLLAQKVLQGATKGYRHHPQLERFQMELDPVAAIATYLTAICEEAKARGYKFDETKIVRRRAKRQLTVTEGQLSYELGHLCAKLKTRDLDRHLKLCRVERPEAHPFFRRQRGGVEAWERL